MTAAQRLHAALAWNERIRLAVEDGDRAARQLPAVQRWQRLRLHQTYADLLQQERYQAACEFFLDELYGGKDFGQRHQDLERVEPIMSRIMPEHLLETVAEALEVQALSLELDLALSAQLELPAAADTGGAVNNDPSTAGITQTRYARAYRASGRESDRRRQIDMIMQVGRALDAVVHKFWVYRLLRLLRGPASAAGFGELQHFLETGFAAFKQLNGAEPFLKAIHDRELQAMQRIFDGDDRPFAHLDLD